MTNSLLKAALSYLERGWSVIPISPRSKKALIKWRDFARRLPTEDEVRAWWSEFPNASVGIVTGKVSNLVVVDVDPDRGGDADEWQRQAPSGVRASTPRGGAHFYYTHPTGREVRNSVDRVADGVDVRAAGGYVVAPPSKGYGWSSGMGAGSVPARYPDLDEVPTKTERSDEPWLQRTLRGVGHGERNDACARLAGYYAKQRIPADVVVEQLLAWNRLNDPPLPVQEVRTTVESVYRTATENAKHVQPTRFELEDDGDDDGKKKDMYALTTFDAYMAKFGAEPVKWLVKDWLPEQTVGMVVAPPGSYKTWLLQDLAVSVASGMPFLGQFPVVKKGPVLFMQQEDWHGQTAHRFSLIASRRANLTLPFMTGNVMHVDVPPRIPIYLHEERRFRFDDQEVVDAWIEKIKQIRPVLVILDPLYSAGSVEDFMAGTARQMFLFKSIRDAYGTTFLIAHHTRKSARPAGEANGRRQSDVPEREDVWGSQFLNAWMETGWQIRRREELGTASIVRHFKVQSEAGRAVLGFDIDTTQLPGKYEVSVKEVKAGEKTDEGADLVALLENHNGLLSVAKLVAMSGLNRSTIFRRMKNLEKAGVVIHTKNGYALNGELNA